MTRDTAPRAGFRAERRRVWQTDFSESETTGGGIWRLCAAIHYATDCLDITVTRTGSGVDALACPAAVVEAERVRDHRRRPGTDRRPSDNGRSILSSQDRTTARGR